MGSEISYRFCLVTSYPYLGGYLFSILFVSIPLVFSSGGVERCEIPLDVLAEVYVAGPVML